ETKLAFSDRLEALRRRPMPAVSVDAPRQPLTLLDQALEFHHELQMATLETHRQYVAALEEQAKMAAALAHNGSPFSADPIRGLAGLTDVSAQLTRLHEEFLAAQWESADLVLDLIRRAAAGDGSGGFVRATTAANSLPPAYPNLSEQTDRPANSFVSPPNPASDPNINLLEAVLNVICEKTGYPRDVIEPEMDLEADLGIDSIKRLEILSELQARLSISESELGLTEIRTISDINSAIARKKPETSLIFSNTSASRPHEKGASVDITDAILDIICEKTGYPKDAIEPEMDLEADLGIDSIKRVEILSAARERLSLELNESDLSELRTIADVGRSLRGQLSAPSSAHATEVTDALHLNAIPVTEPILRDLPSIVRRDVVRSHENGDFILIVSDGGPVTTSLAEQISTVSPASILLDPSADAQQNGAAWRLPDWEEDSLRTALAAVTKRGRVRGLIRIWERPTGPEVERCGLKHSVLLSGLLKSDLDETDKSRVLYVVRLDGSLGLSATPPSSLMGSIGGLAKTLRHEWPAIPVRWLDLGAPSSAQLEAGRISDEFFDRLLEPVEVGYSDHGRVTINWQPATPPTEQQERAADTTETIVVTGGARGITASCIVELAKRRRFRMAILARTPLSELDEEWKDLLHDEARLKAALAGSLKSSNATGTAADIEAAYRRVRGMFEIHETLRALERAGVSARYIETDVSDSGSVRAA